MEENLKQCQVVIDKAVAEGAQAGHSEIHLT